MDWFVAVFVLPEVLLLVLGFFAIFVSLAGSGEFKKLKPLYKPRGSEVDPTYWGQYVRREVGSANIGKSPQAIAASNSQAATAGGIVLPTIKKIVEPAKWEKDWTGGPQE